MPSDFDELLIFKMRGIKKPIAAKENAAQENQGILAQIFVPRPPPESEIKQDILVEQERYNSEIIKGKADKLREIAAGEERAKKERADKENAAMLRERAEKETGPDLRGRIEPDTAYGKEYAGSVKSRYGSGGKDAVKIVLTKEQSIDAAAGLQCVNHPWRSAYAVCAYCKMGYCYADIIERGSSLFCFNDVDRASGAVYSEKNIQHTVTRIGGLFFVATAAIIFYFMYPQISVLEHATPGSIIYYIIRDAVTYPIPAINIAISLIGIAAGIMVVASPRRWAFRLEIVAAFTIIIATYEYQVSSVMYLIGISMLAFIAMIVVIVGERLAYNMHYQKENLTSKIMWPRLETF
jgi:hypothetical protein